MTQTALAQNTNATVTMNAIHRLVGYNADSTSSLTFERRAVPAGGALNSHYIYVIESGLVKTTLSREKTLHFSRPRQVVGLESLYASEEPLRFESFAILPSFVIAIPKSLVRTFPEQFPWLFRVMSNHMAHLSRVSYYLSTHGANARIAWMLLEESRRNGAQGRDTSVIVFDYTRIEIATYLDVTNETVSRVLGDMQMKGLVRMCGARGREIELKNIEGIRALVGSPPTVPVHPDNMYALAA